MQPKKANRSAGFFSRERFLYWFDTRVTKGSLGLIRGLIIASILLALLIAGAIILLGFSEEGETASVFWDSIATVINAWMPSFEDGSPGYLILMSVTAIAGVLFTSVLIGIVTSAIEQKIIELKRGNSVVMEEDHIVVLGFYPGEFTLLRQLILAAEENDACIVLAEDMDREEMEQSIKENLDVPKNVRIVCRTVDITDPASIEKCSVERCRTVIISPTEDARTIKAILAVSALLQEKDAEGIRVNAIIAKGEYRFPPSLAESHNISTFQTPEILAKVIAHSCTQTGLSEVFREVFNFEGSEFCLTQLPQQDGLRFEELTVRMDHAVPAGVFREERMLLAPSPDFLLREEDRILVFSEDSASVRLEEPLPPAPVPEREEAPIAAGRTDTVIIGRNETLPIVLRELPENVDYVCLVNGEFPEEELEELRAGTADRKLQLDCCCGDLHSEEFLLSVAQMAEHVVILSDHELDGEEADMQAIFLLLNLRDLRSRYGLSFNLTVEMQKEQNQSLVGHGDHTDFLVASSMSSLILAQLAENPELRLLFRELLSNEGSELYLKKAEELRLLGTRPVSAVRRSLLRRGYVLLGLLNAEKRCRFDLSLSGELTLSPEDSLIVIGSNG